MLELRGGIRGHTSAEAAAALGVGVDRIIKSIGVICGPRAPATPSASPSAVLLLLRGDVRADLSCVARAVGVGRKQVGPHGVSAGVLIGVLTGLLYRTEFCQGTHEGTPESTHEGYSTMLTRILKTHALPDVHGPPLQPRVATRCFVLQRVAH